jgi:peptidoglycan/xylan/chitin deacetylase (PgdA/CDA1 family)
MVTIDLEGAWGMPFDDPYDLLVPVERILECLDSHGVQAVFFALGELVEVYPGVIRTIAEAGHEVGLHAYHHVPFSAMDAAALERARADMSRAEAVIAEITGTRPVAFRAPYLLAPQFQDPRVDAILRDHGFRWQSNCETRHAVELTRPGLVRTRALSDALRARPGVSDGELARVVTILLNLRLLRRSSPPGSIVQKLRWMAGGNPPFPRGGITEVPVTGPLDCDVIGFPRPSESSTEDDLAFAAFAMERSLAGRGGLAMLTFHDWLTGSANRIELLDHTLTELRRLGLTPVQSADLLAEVPALA